MIEPATTPIDRHGIFFAGTRAHADACESGHLHTQSRPRRPGSRGRAEDSRSLIADHRNVAEALVARLPMAPPKQSRHGFRSAPGVRVATR
jgi:hypothetical protein